MNKVISVKVIITAIEEYYNGKPIDLVCAELKIDHTVFDDWLFRYKQVVLEIMNLKLENERLRKIYVDLVLFNQGISLTAERNEDKQDPLNKV